MSALTVSSISVQSLDSFLRQKVHQRFPRVANRLSRELDHWYVLRGRELEVFASSSILAKSAPHLGTRSRKATRAHKETEQYLRYVLDSFPQFERLVLANANGEPLVEVGDGNPVPKDLLAATTPSMETNSISGAFRIGDQLIQIASTPMRDTSGRAIGRLYALIDLDFLSPTLTSREFGETASVFLIDPEMRFLNPPVGLDPDTRFVIPEADPDRNDLTVPGVSHYDNVENIRVVGTQVAFPRFGWTLVLEQRYDEAFAPVISSIGRVAGLNLAIVLIVSLVASRIAGSFVKPLRALSDAAKRLSRG